MSYNITSFKVKKLNNLIIPIKALENKSKKWEATVNVKNVDTMEVMVECGGEQSIEGTLKEGNLYVSKIDMYGECSGSYIHDVFKDALKQSTGELEAVAIWEGGDTVERISVKDGNFSQENIDL